MSGFFLSCGLEVVCLEEVFLVMCTFFKEKSAQLEGLESYVVQKN